jgi:outer membrane receptor protein involved in Fe transport
VKSVVLAFLFACFAVTSFNALAQEKGPGKLRIVVFSESAPKEGVKVLVSARRPAQEKDDDDQFENFKILTSKTTDGFGSATFGLRQGYYWVRFEGENVSTKPLKVAVGSEETTQMMLSLLGKDLRAEFELEQPEIRLKSDSLEASKDQKKISGQVVDAATGKPLSGVRVFVPGSAEVFVTDEKGEFESLVSKEAPRISLVAKRYSSRTLEIDPEKPSMKIELSKAGLKLEELVILAPSLEGSVAAFLEIRRKSSSVADVLGAEQISKAGDGDAASSLRRVTGLTLVKGKYIYIRGLGERYAATLMNGGTLPSPDPGRPIVPLDMFPAGILEGMVIQKSYSADLPGSFGGGSILLKTKGVPDRFQGSLSTSVGFNDANDRLLSYQGGGTDWMGVDDGTRALPQKVIDATKSGRLLAFTGDDRGYSKEELAELGKEFPNIYNLDEDRAVRSSAREIPPSLSFSVGDLYKNGKWSAGYRTSLLYDPSVSNRAETRNSVQGGDRLVLDNPISFKRTQTEINTGGILDTGIQYGDNVELGYTGMILRKTQDTRQIGQGITGADGDEISRFHLLEWVERELISQQAKLRWEYGKGVGKDKAKPGVFVRYGWSKAQRYSPDTREYVYEDFQDGRGFRLDSDTNGISRTYSELYDNANDLGLDFVVPVEVFDNATQLKFGFARQNKRRVSDTRRFNFLNQQNNDIDLGQDLEEITSPPNINPDGYLPIENSLSTDDYTGEQIVNATYAMVDTPVTDRFRVSVGGRYELSTQTVSTFNLLSATEDPVVAEHKTEDFFPVYSATAFLTDRAQVRLAYSETINRPSIRELSSAPFLDPDLGRLIYGNNLLVSSVIKHWDARWEYYLNREESVSFGAFAKEFSKPIESIIEPGSNQTRTYQNAESATNYGFEAEFSKNLSFIGMKRWTFSANYARIFSKIELPDDVPETFMSSDRPLQGLSPWIANMTLFWEGKKARAGLLYNAFGERIVDVGTQGLPDVVEQPIHQLDLVTRWSLVKNTNLSFRVRNLLDQSVVLKQDKFVVQEFRMGQSYSVGLSQQF